MLRSYWLSQLGDVTIVAVDTQHTSCATEMSAGSICLEFGAATFRGVIRDAVFGALWLGGSH